MDLYLYLQNTLLKDHNSAGVMSSISNMIVTPALTLARKVGTGCFT